MRNTKAFKEAVAQTLTELAGRDVTLTPATVEDTIEQNVQAVANQLRIHVRSAWRYFDASALADSLTQSVRELKTGPTKRSGKLPCHPRATPSRP
ncbi:hypothetical protein [Streptomyces barringtoniae]|uniref:hypothetical protein n=1 Tax=Streptomyces barringtoniae TaxID=2892029 RepID=UPI001E30B82C|nr:hypothetical protein [Streptomyces barringtoniae]MCC5481067.1 hypothetical protein [Streptomyces barringtoniae]